jgi:hypothetical protein
MLDDVKSALFEEADQPASPPQVQVILLCLALSTREDTGTTPPALDQGAQSWRKRPSPSLQRQGSHKGWGQDLQRHVDSMAVWSTQKGALKVEGRSV